MVLRTLCLYTKDLLSPMPSDELILLEGKSRWHKVRSVELTHLPKLIRDVTEYLQLLLRKSGYNFHTTAEKEVVRIIKEKTCYIPVNPVKEEKETSGKTDDFMLPDGNIIRVSTQTRQSYVEIFDFPLILIFCETT